MAPRWWSRAGSRAPAASSTPTRCSRSAPRSSRRRPVASPGRSRGSATRPVPGVPIGRSRRPRAPLRARPRALRARRRRPRGEEPPRRLDARGGALGRARLRLRDARDGGALPRPRDGRLLARLRRVELRAQHGAPLPARGALGRAGRLAPALALDALHLLYRLRPRAAPPEPDAHALGRRGAARERGLLPDPGVLRHRPLRAAPGRSGAIRRHGAEPAAPAPRDDD